MLACLRGADQAGEITGTGASVSLSISARESEIKRRTKHVAAHVDSFSDRGSIPLTSILRFATRERSEVCHAVAHSAKADGFPFSMAKLRLGRPDSINWYVYVLQSESNSDRYYVSYAEDVNSRLEKHNSGQVPYTSKHLSWKLTTVVGFSDKAKAINFEKYLKSGSGRAFSKKHF